MKPQPPDDLWERLDAITGENLLIRPAGGFTTEEYADRKGLSRHTARGILERLADRNLINKLKSGRIVYWQLIEK
jgi:predicted transcriptional regulator